MLLFVFCLQLRARKPIFAIGECHGIAHCGQCPIVFAAFWPRGVTLDCCRCKVGHLDGIFVKEVVQFDVMAFRRGRANPLTIANQ